MSNILRDMRKAKSTRELNPSKFQSNAGSVIPHSAAGILLRYRRKKDRASYIKGGEKTPPLETYNPFPDDEKHGLDG